MELAGLTIHALHDKLMRGEVSAMALTEAVLTRLAAVEERVHAYITMTPELARQLPAAERRRFQTLHLQGRARESVLQLQQTWYISVTPM